MGKFFKKLRKDIKKVIIIPARYGLKTKVALVESFITMISCIYALVPWGFDFNINVLCLIPVFCIMTSCNISSYSSIMSGATMFLGTASASLYCYLVIMIARDIRWITFIITFFYSYIIATLVMMPGRRWLAGLFMKKMFLDIIVVLYFTPIESVYQNIWQNIVAGAFIYSSVLIGALLFPNLASRLFFRKTIKTMHSARIYFKALGYQLDDKIFNNLINQQQQQQQQQQNNNNILNGTTLISNSGAVTNSIFFDSGNLNNNNNNNNQQQQQPFFLNQYHTPFEQIENELLKEQQLKQSNQTILFKSNLLSNCGNSSILNSSSNSLFSNNTLNSNNTSNNNNNNSRINFDFPNFIPVLPQNSNNNNVNTSFEEKEKLKLPLARSMIIDKNTVIDIKQQEKQLQQQLQQILENNNEIELESIKSNDINQTNLNSPINNNVEILSSTNSSSSNNNNNNNNELKNSQIIPRILINSPELQPQSTLSPIKLNNQQQQQNDENQENQENSIIKSNEIEMSINGQDIISNKNEITNNTNNSINIINNDKEKIEKENKKIIKNLTSETNDEISKLKIKELKKNKNELESSEVELELLEVKLGNELTRMQSLFNESKAEFWNSDLNSIYSKLLLMFDLAFKQIISIKMAMRDGFSQLASQELISPLVPFIECVIEEVYLQMGLMIDILSSKKLTIQSSPSPSPSSPQSTTTTDNQNNNKVEDVIGIVSSILYNSFDETEELVHRVRGAFKKVVDQYQKNNHPILNETEVSKVHFFVHGIMSFTLQQRQIADTLIEIKNLQRKESVRVEIIKHGVFFVFFSFPLMIWKILKFVAHFFRKYIFRYCKSESKQPPQKEQIISEPIEKELVIVKLLKWIQFNFFINNKWRYPFQVAFGLLSTIIPFYYFDGKSHGKFIVHGVWTCATVMLVMVPSVGATITRGFHRFNGTIAGALVGYATSLLCSIIPTPAKEIVILLITFIFCFLISFPQQDVRHSYAGAVSGITFLLIVLGQNKSKDFDYMYGVLRAFHIALGVIWVIIIGMVVFPYFSYKNSRIKIFKIANEMSDTFINIIEHGLRMSEEITANNNMKLSIFYEKLKEQQEEEIISLKNNNDSAMEINGASKLDNSPINGNVVGDKNIEIDQSINLSKERRKIIIEILKSCNEDEFIDHNYNEETRQSQYNLNAQYIHDNDYNLISINDEIIQNRRVMKKKIMESIRSIKSSIDQVKLSLYDIRSEMVLVSPSKVGKYFTIVDKINESFTRLAALENSFDPIFSDLLIISMFELRKPLNQLFNQLNHSKYELNQLIAGKYNRKTSLKAILDSSSSINDSLSQFGQTFQSIRSLLLGEKVFHHLHPEMIQFGSGIHSIQAFIKAYTELIEELRSIRKEKSYLKSFLRIKH